MPGLRCVLGQFGETLAMLLRRRDDPHLLPVVRKFLATVQTCDVRSGQTRGLGAARFSANGYWETIARVLAPKYGVI
jgi:hypothetical protein